MLVVGQPFPKPLHPEGARYWDVGTNMLVLSEPQLSADEAFVAKRVWFVSDGPVIGLLVTFANGAHLDLPGVWVDTEARPDWIDDDTPGHRFFTMVLVDSATNLIVHMSGFTLSEHATRLLAQRARRAWEQPLPRDQVMDAVLAYQSRFDDDQAIRQGAFVTSRAGD